MAVCRPRITRINADVFGSERWAPLLSGNTSYFLALLPLPKTSALIRVNPRPACGEHSPASETAQDLDPSAFFESPPPDLLSFQSRIASCTRRSMAPWRKMTGGSDRMSRIVEGRLLGNLP